MSDIAYAPPSFDNPDGMKVIFVDFTHAKYRLKFDVSAHTATVFSEITFKADDHGLAAIILNQPVISARLDGIDVGVVHQESPDAEASFKVLSKPVSPGAHVLTIQERHHREGSLRPSYHMDEAWQSGVHLQHVGPLRRRCVSWSLLAIQLLLRPLPNVILRNDRKCKSTPFGFF